MAVTQLVSGSIVGQPCQTLEEVFEITSSGRARFGVVPIENSLVGSIHKTYDLLLEHDLKIVGECYRRIVHCLIASKTTSFKQVKRVFSHPVALEQCQTFFREHPSIVPVSHYDTAGAVKMLTESNMHDAAAIAGEHAAQAYGMKVLRKSIEDEKANYTRFILLSRRSDRFTGDAKTSIVFSMKNLPGVLFKALSVFALRDIDLTRIESRPVRKRAWEYHFYLDFAASVREDRVKKALDHLGEITTFVRVLGSYPRSDKL